MSSENNHPPAEPDDEEARILAPDFSLKKIIGEDVDIKQLFSADNIAKAQAVINQHVGGFLGWVTQDLAALDQSYQKAAQNPAASEGEVRKLARGALVIKSQAGTFGFALASTVAKSLDDFCSQSFRPVPEHLLVIRKHLDTLTAIFQQNISGDGGAVGQQLTGSLSQLIAKYSGTA